MTNNITHRFPDDLIFPDIQWFDQPPVPIVASSINREVIAGLKKGTNYYFSDTWGTAMAFYSWLKKQINSNYPVKDYATSRTHQDILKSLSGNLFVKITGHKASLTKAPDNPWIREFFPDKSDFYISFPDFLGLNGARQWFENGVGYPGLNQKIYPFYGTYFPTRNEHLILFDKWLQNQKNIDNAIDMGAGCGVLSFYMLKHNVKNIIAVDINPNALYSISINLKKYDLENNVSLRESSFFDNINTQNTDLIVFNPPWIPGKSDGIIEKAMYYENNFFSNFFNDAYDKLPEKCIIAIIFSNFSHAAGLPAKNPIEEELSINSRFTFLERHGSEVIQKPSKRKSWLSEIRKKEKVELWVLKKV